MTAYIMKIVVPVLTTPRVAAAKHINASSIFFLEVLAYILPQKSPASIAVPVPREVMVPTWVPLNPMELRYCPMSGHIIPRGQYMKKYKNALRKSLFLFIVIPASFKTNYSISNKISANNIMKRKLRR